VVVVSGLLVPGNSVECLGWVVEVASGTAYLVPAGTKEYSSYYYQVVTF